MDFGSCGRLKLVLPRFALSSATLLVSPEEEGAMFRPLASPEEGTNFIPRKSPSLMMANSMTTFPCFICADSGIRLYQFSLTRC